MGRALSVLAVLLLAGALLWLPSADPVRVAALRVSDLLAQEVVRADGSRAPLAAELLAGSAAVRDPQGRLLLRLGGVRIVSSAYPSGDLLVHGLARRSLASALRQWAHQSGGTLQLEGELTPAPGGLNVLVELEPAGLALRADAPDGASLAVRSAGWRPPGREVLFPPLAAILLAILFRRPVLALFAGVWAAMFLLRLRAPDSGAPGALLRGLQDVGTRLLWPEVVDPQRLQTTGFVIAMLCMVGVMTRSGGIRGLMDLVAVYARDARRTQVAAWLVGLAVFFDDYANCILVGTTMRPLCDRFRISREKLAYLVDSTAAPVAGLCLFSTWIAFEVSTFSAQLPAAGLLPSEGYAVFLQTLPFRFYCLLTLLLAGAIACSGRDFGPMLAAERRARSAGLLVRSGGRPLVKDAATHLDPVPGLTPRAHRALLPLLAFVVVTTLEVVRVGLAALRAREPDLALSDVLTLRGLTDLFGNGDSTRALLLGSSSGLALALILACSVGVGREVLRAAWTTLRSLGIAIAILYLAWMTGRACDLLSTAPYLTALLGDHLAPELLPAILFLTSSLVAFSTGSSWGTMSILLPLVVGLGIHLGGDSHLGGRLLMVMSIAAVLEGSIFGDHCSPISDTTVLSSTASACDHIDHVRTQLPYAVVTMLVALCVGYLPCAFAGHHPALSLALAAALLLMLVLGFGRKSAPTALPAP